MNDLTTLTQNIHILAREHKTRHHDETTGKTTYPTELSLFDQLRLELESGRRATGTSGNGSRSPIALGAVILWNEIRETLNTTTITITGHDQPTTTPEQKLELWITTARQTNDQALTQRCIRKTTAWINAINDLINPEPSIEISGACPACHQTHAWTLEDGEYRRNTALTATITTAKCRTCQAEWARQDFENLAATIH